MLAWTEQENVRGLNIRVATKSCNTKLVIRIIRPNMNHNSSTALERSVINNWGRGLKPVLNGSNLTLIFCSDSQHSVSCSVLASNL